MIAEIISKYNSYYSKSSNKFVMTDDKVTFE
jgi:hypothetical protein